eukprot:1351428-Amorphochlora_amoeboformis.AAC.2
MLRFRHSFRGVLRRVRSASSGTKSRLGTQFTNTSFEVSKMLQTFIFSIRNLNPCPGSRSGRGAWRHSRVFRMCIGHHRLGRWVEA